MLSVLAAYLVGYFWALFLIYEQDEEITVGTVVANLLFWPIELGAALCHEFPRIPDTFGEIMDRLDRYVIWRRR